MAGGESDVNLSNSDISAAGRQRPARFLSRLAYVFFALYLILLLGANSVAAAGGPPAWLPLLPLPAAGGDWVPIGVVALLPPLSAAAWLAGRALAGARGLTWGPRRLTLPLAALGTLALLRVVWPCLDGVCVAGDVARLAILLLQLAWVYLYVVNERPPLLAVVVAILLLQSTVALGQFLLQRDVGLAWLGETSLDPRLPGVGVVMRGDDRWLRAYGLTPHPNSLARLLVPMLLFLVVAGRQPTTARRLIVAATFVLGWAALFATLARWANVCFVIGLAVACWPWLRRGLRDGRWSPAPLDPLAIIPLAIVAIGLLAAYGDVVLGRTIELDTPLEARSLQERERDTTIALRLLAEHPLTGVGLRRYLDAARAEHPQAMEVHNVPLRWGVELGLAGAALWLWLLLAPLWRRDWTAPFAATAGLWLGFWLLGLFYPGPNTLLILRDALLVGLVAGVVAQADSLRPRPAG